MDISSAASPDVKTHTYVVGCEDCGRPYGDEFGFPDLVVTHDIWEQLMPGRQGGGLLCPSCMCKRAYNLGIETQAVFRSGPFCQPVLWM